MGVCVDFGVIFGKGLPQTRANLLAVLLEVDKHVLELLQGKARTNTLVESMQGCAGENVTMRRLVGCPEARR